MADPRSQDEDDPDPIGALSKQAIAVLKEIPPLSGKSRYVCPSLRANTRPMSENTGTSDLRRLGYSGHEMTGSGFRSLASTRLTEMAWNLDALKSSVAKPKG